MVSIFYCKVKFYSCIVVIIALAKNGSFIFVHPRHKYKSTFALFSICIKKIIGKHHAPKSLSNQQNYMLPLNGASNIIWITLCSGTDAIVNFVWKLLPFWSKLPIYLIHMLPNGARQKSYLKASSTTEIQKKDF